MPLYFRVFKFFWFIFFCYILEEDKKSAKGERKKKTKGNVAQPLIVTERTPSAGNVTQKSGSAGSGRASVSPGTRQGRGFQASLPPMSRTPSNPDLGGPESKPGTPMSEKEMLEWYQVQLYQKFGPEKADYFLHPKIEQKTTKPIHPKLHKHGGVFDYCEFIYRILVKYVGSTFV